MGSRPRSKLTELQTQVVDAVMTGAPLSEVSMNPTQALRSATVQREIAAARQELSDATTLKRLDVIEGILDGIQTARMMSDGGNMIRGWCEIGKILGHYAPEVKTLNLSVNNQRVISKLEGLSDEALFELMQGRGRTLEHGEQDG